jgi:hypothetical protein
MPTLDTDLVDQLDDALCVLDNFNKFFSEFIDGKYRRKDFSDLSKAGGLLDQTRDLLVENVLSCLTVVVETTRSTG